MTSMGGSVPIDRRTAVLACAQVLADHNGKDTIVLDLTELNTWTDYFVVTTATSSAHLGGLARQLADYLAQEGLDPTRKPQVANDEEWCLVDVGWFVVHLMSGPAREFYELEKLWFQASSTPVSPSGALPAVGSGK
jgi:ribosome-associated protein